MPRTAWVPPIVCAVTSFFGHLGVFSWRLLYRSTATVLLLLLLLLLLITKRSRKADFATAVCAWLCATHSLGARLRFHFMSHTPTMYIISESQIELVGTTHTIPHVEQFHTI
ncbi:hypothetical protein BJY52DRAFT_1285320 [Lactarius psammicola]|nr:hypothetical protein BJY52DRAFT_1285320 [Lactarius psammicola]